MIDSRKAVETLLKADSTVNGLTAAFALVTAKKDDPFPRVYIREAANEPSLYADGRGWEAMMRVHIWIYAKKYDEWASLISAVDDAMKAAKWSRVSVGEDDFITNDVNAYQKDIIYMRVNAQRPTT